MKIYDYYFDNDLYYTTLREHISDVSPHNATRMPIPLYKVNQIPRFNKELNSWYLVEDHRQKSDNSGNIIEYSGTPYWLPEDIYTALPRYMITPGPLPKNAIVKDKL